MTNDDRRQGGPSADPELRGGDRAGSDSQLQARLDYLFRNAGKEMAALELKALVAAYRRRQSA